MFKPPMKGMLRNTFQSKEQSKRNKFADGKFGLIVFFAIWQHIIYTAKQFCDKLFLGHGFGFLCVWFRHLHFRNFSVTFLN